MVPNGMWDEVLCTKTLNYACQKPTAVSTKTVASYTTTAAAKTITIASNTNTIATKTSTLATSTPTVSAITMTATTCPVGWTISGALCYKHHPESVTYEYAQVSLLAN